MYGNDHRRFRALQHDRFEIVDRTGAVGIAYSGMIDAGLQPGKLVGAGPRVIVRVDVELIIAGPALRQDGDGPVGGVAIRQEIGRASCRERV